MIKKLRLKFVLVFLVLVVSVFITSSCYASDTWVIESPFTKEDLFNTSKFRSNYSDLKAEDCKIVAFYTNTNKNYPYQVYICVNNYNSIKYINQSATTQYSYFFNSDNSYVDSSIVSLSVNSSGEYNGYRPSEPSTTNHIKITYGSMDTTSNVRLLDITEFECRYDNTIVHSIKADTSFTYSLNGVKRGQVELKIENLDSSLKMYGYVGYENNFNVGDTLDTSIISSYLRLLSMYSDNSDLSCTLYEGEKLLYYIVDENNVILDIGYISELAEGYFLYGFPISDGVDFVFLNNGQVYWNNELTFKYQVDNGSLLTKNEIVSTGSYSYIESNKTSAKITYNGFVYDSNGEVISSAITSTTNNLSSLYIKEVNTNYFENNIGFNKSCYWLQSIILAGTDSSGNDIDFSNYSVRWSIPTWLTVDSIEIGTSTYDKYNGVITGFSSNGLLSIQLKIFELLKNHTKDFDITLEIYNENGDLVLKYLVNSDDIVRNQILSEENNIDRPSYDIIDNPNYTGGSNNYPGSDNIHNWGVDDFANYLGTNNTMFNFFWAFLNNMPTWISTPLTILLIGLVVITLYKFIRG